MYLKKLSVFGYLLVLMLLCTACGNAGDRYSCRKIPVGDGKLSWGMSADEIVDVLGEPTSEEPYEYGGAVRMLLLYEYDTPVQSKLGSCSQVVLRISDEGSAINGLAWIELVIDETTKESVVEKLADFYGELSPRGGSTQMEFDLKKGNPDYFNETHWCDAWKMETLTEKEYDLMAESYDAITGGKYAALKGDTLLMDVNISGILSEEKYSCTVWLYGDKMCFFENLGL